MGVAGLGGFAQGGILEALKRPIISTTTETFKYGRKGSAYEGLVIEKVTKVREFSVGDVLVMMIAGGIIYVAAFKDWDWPDLPGIPNPILEAMDPLGLTDLTPEDRATVVEVVQKAIDPFGLFDLTGEEKASVLAVIKDAIDPFKAFH